MGFWFDPTGDPKKRADSTVGNNGYLKKYWEIGVDGNGLGTNIDDSVFTSNDYNELIEDFRSQIKENDENDTESATQFDPYLNRDYDKDYSQDYENCDEDSAQNNSSSLKGSSEYDAYFNADFDYNKSEIATGSGTYDDVIKSFKEELQKNREKEELNSDAASRTSTTSSAATPRYNSYFDSVFDS